MKSLTSLWEQLAIELASLCGTSTLRDCKTVSDRVEHEGISFLTITLPSFGKAFERSLDEKRLVPSRFVGFTSRAGLPVFLQGFLERVFDRNGGCLLDTPDIDSIQAIRQLSLMFGKIELECSPRRKADAYDRYIKCDEEVKAHKIGGISDRFASLSSELFRSVLLAMDRKIFNQEVLPRHGPGSTAERQMGNIKFSNRNWTRRLQDILPWEYYLAPSPRAVEDISSTVCLLEPWEELPVRVISVPKTQVTPRIIAIEPVNMMFMQQGLMQILVDEIGKDYYLSSFLGFDDQVPNNELARSSSSDGSLATLDLSEASDRVSCEHIELLTSRHTLSREALFACRSRYADVPGHGVIALSKFASMGSAVTFPLEAMVFLTIVLIGIERQLRRPLTLKDLNDLRGRVRIFGDDIIVPVDYVSSVVDSLEDFGFKVNNHKSFWNGKFRESCGKEYYDGHDVSIVKVRNLIPSTTGNAEQVISYVSFRNQLYEFGYWRTCRWIDNQIRKFMRFPTVSQSSPALGRHSYLGYETQRMDGNLHRPLVKALVATSQLPVNPISDWGALLKCFSFQQDFPNPNEDHLKRSGRPSSVALKTRWTVPF